MGAARCFKQLCSSQNVIKRGSMLSRRGRFETSVLLRRRGHLIIYALLCSSWSSVLCRFFVSTSSLPLQLVLCFARTGCVSVCLSVFTFVIVFSFIHSFQIRFMNLHCVSQQHRDAKMQLTFALVLMGAWVASANPIARDVADNTAAVGTNPIQVASTEALGLLTADNSCSHRDLGFWGPISGVWYAIYGDTSFCAEGVTDPAQDPSGSFNGMVRDSISTATDNPLKVHDLNLNDQTPVAHQNQFVPFNPAWGETSSWGFGGTSICQTSRKNKEAIIFYLRVSPSTHDPHTHQL